MIKKFHQMTTATFTTHKNNLHYKEQDVLV